MNARALSESPSLGSGPLLQLIDRLCAMIQEETSALRSGQKFNLEELNRRKNHAVLELRRLTDSQLVYTASDPALRQRFSVLQTLLQENETILQRHLSAARQISDMLGEAVAENDSDGTYSRPQICGNRSQ